MAYPPLPEDMTGIPPDPSQNPPWMQGVDFTPETAGSGPGMPSAWRMALAQQLAANPPQFGFNRHSGGTDAQSFMQGFLPMVAGTYARRTLNQAAASPHNPANIVAMRKRNMEGMKYAADLADSRANLALKQKELAKIDQPAKTPARYLSADDAARFGLPLGVTATPIDQLPPETLARLAPAKKEGTPEDPSIALTDEELDLPALRYLKDGTMIPAGMGQNGVALRTKVIKRANYLRKAAGLSGDIAANAAQMKADAKSFSTLQTQADGLRAFENTALANAKQLLAASDKVPDTGSPFVNDLVRTAAKGFLGSDQVSNFQSAMEPVNAEFARILQSGGSLGGQLTDTARKDMRSVMSGNFTRKQLRGSLAILERDAENRRKAYADQLGIIRARMMWGAMLVNGPGQQPPAQPPPSGDWFDQNSPEAGK